MTPEFRVSERSNDRPEDMDAAAQALVLANLKAGMLLDLEADDPAPGVGV